MKYQVTANGTPLTVHQRPVRAYDIKTYSQTIYKHIADAPAFAILTGTGPVTFEVTPDRPFRSVKIRPLSAGVKAETDGTKAVFTVDAPRNLSVEFDGELLEPLFLFYSEKTPVPEKVDYYFGPGEHDAGNIELKSGQTVYIEDGAWVWGSITSDGADDIAILGEGVLCGEKIHRDPWMHETPAKQGWNGKSGRLLLDLARGRNIRVGRLTLFDGQSWHCRLLNVEHAVVDGVRIISMNPSGDGVDVCNSRHVRVKNCFFRTNDDCITIKALLSGYGDGERKNMYDIVSENCVCWSATHGNGLEVGYETCTAEMYDIHFLHCDVIHCEREGYQSGGTLTIHNGDRADIHDVSYEDIRIEDSREKIFDLKICNACWSHDPVRGQIRNVLFKDIAVVDGPFPPSIIRGFESETSEFAVKHTEDGKLWVLRDLHGEGTLRDITIENFTVYGEKKTDFMAAKCVVEIATNVEFK